MKCQKCNGSGVSGDYIVNGGICYRNICSKCLGKCYLDWIENITGIKKDVFGILHMLESNLKPDNYIFIMNGSTYFVKRPYFLIKNDTDEKWKNIIMQVSFKTGGTGHR